MMKIKSLRIEERSSALPRKDFFAKPRIYFTVPDSTAPPKVNLLKDVFVPGVLEQVGMKGTKTVWSRKAGCKCGCTPGFIVQMEHNKARVALTHHDRRVHGQESEYYGRLITPFDVLVELEWAR